MTAIDDPRIRCCRVCRRDLPLDAEHFHRHKGRKYGFREICRECRNKKRQVDRRELYGRAQKTLLLKLARDVIQGRCSAGHVEVVSVLASNLGGAEGIGRMMAEMARHPKTKPRTAVTILHAVLAMSERLEQSRRQEAAQRPEELSQLSREDLEVHLLQLTEQLLKKQGLKIVPIDG